MEFQMARELEQVRAGDAALRQTRQKILEIRLRKQAGEYQALIQSGDREKAGELLNQANETRQQLQEIRRKAEGEHVENA